jgi:hypothetical protein
MRKKSVYRLLFALSILIVSLSACGNAPGEVTGTVRRVGSGELVAEGQVVVFALNTFKNLDGLEVYERGDVIRTQNLDESGTYSFSLSPGNYVIEAWVPQVATVRNQIEIRAGRTTTADLEVVEPSQ